MPAAEASSFSPPVPLVASRQTQELGSELTHRRLALSPFPSPGASLARQPHLPTHLHPFAQAYPIAAAGEHAHTILHPGFVYFAPGPGQSGLVLFVMPVQWPVPGTPPGSHAGQAQHPAAFTATPSSDVKTPAVAQPTAATESSATPMDSLVSAAQMLIEDKDYDGDSLDVEGDGEAPAVPTETEATAKEVAT